jgi:hypothetical protein
MSIRFGYACLNVTLGPRRGGFRGMIKRTWEREGLPHASRIAVGAQGPRSCRRLRNHACVGVGRVGTGPEGGGQHRGLVPATTTPPMHYCTLLTLHVKCWS